MITEETIALANKAGWSVADLLDGFGTRLERFAKLVAEAEREACAKVCEQWGAWNKVAQDCAEEIRARGNK